jgi:hypothetical protein
MLASSGACEMDLETGDSAPDGSDPWDEDADGATGARAPRFNRGALKRFSM